MDSIDLGRQAHHNQRSGKALQDERTIASYGLSAGSVLHLMIKPASTPADKTVAAPPPASKTEGAPEQESASVSPQTPMRSLSERMKDLESQVSCAIGRVCVRL